MSCSTVMLFAISFIFLPRLRILSGFLVYDFIFEFLFVFDVCVWAILTIKACPEFAAGTARVNDSRAATHTAPADKIDVGRVPVYIIGGHRRSTPLKSVGRM